METDMTTQGKKIQSMRAAAAAGAPSCELQC